MRKGRLVKSEGYADAELVLIGEAPGAWEDRLGRPFIGPSYNQRLKPWWDLAGLDRRQFYITNLYPYQPPKNDLSKIDLPVLDLWTRRLHERLAALEAPKVIVPAGNYALRALLGFPLRSTKAPKISDWRGSVTWCKLNDGRQVKVIPVIHPAATFRNASLVKLCVADWSLIAQDMHFPEMQHPERLHYIPGDEGPSVLYQLIKASDDPDTVMAIDIETNPKTKQILCIGFAVNSDWSLTLPWDDRWANVIRDLCLSPAQKVLQNGLYDTYWLAAHGYTINNFVWDTLAMHHAIDATLPHALATQASLYTRQPFWKRDAKDGEALAVSKDFTAVMRYCGTDCCVTWELQAIHYNRLKRQQREEIQ